MKLYFYVKNCFMLIILSWLSVDEVLLFCYDFQQIEIIFSILYILYVLKFDFD